MAVVIKCPFTIYDIDFTKYIVVNNALELGTNDEYIWIYADAIGPLQTA